MIPAELPLNSAVVAGEKYPPVKVIDAALPGFCAMLSGAEATIAGRVGFTASTSGPGTFGLLFWRSTETWSDPATFSRLAGIVARSSPVLIKVVGTAAAVPPGGATYTVSFEKKFDPVR